VIERVADLWATPADARVVPVNWTLKRNGEAVMGAGVALAAAAKYPWLSREQGAFMRMVGPGTAVGVFRTVSGALVTFPTKYDWREPSDLELIEKSARELVAATEDQGFRSVALPCVGCGLGRLTWSDVRVVLAPILDDRFVVVTPEAGRP
jgi:O-acetyl-ADP-ribose deacetylase (regulator of RNase III)